MEVPFRFRTSLMPPLDIQVIGSSVPPSSEELFKVETELLKKYQDRQEEIEQMREMRKERRETKDSSARNRKSMEIKLMQEEQDKRNQERKQREQVQNERYAKAQQMMACCRQINDMKTATFYLESQNWDLEKALAFYREYTGDVPQSLYVKKSIRVRFEFPDGKTLDSEFDPSGLLWQVMPVIYSNLPEKREFLVRTHNEIISEVITEETMTTRTFKELSPGSEFMTMEIEYT